MSRENPGCPFCIIDSTSFVAENDSCFAIRDGFPVAPGHTLIVPRRHVASFFDLTADEKQDMVSLIDDVKLDIEQSQSPDGYNIGINDGEIAGQTVMHVHLHVIPRRAGDVTDPRGGIRWILPTKAPYWNDET